MNINTHTAPATELSQDEVATTAKKEKIKLPEGPIPIPFVRSSLFSISTTRSEPIEKKALVVDKGPLGISISYAGPKLHQEHSKLFQALLCLARQRGGLDGNEFHLYLQDLLRFMGKDYRDQDQTKNVWKWIVDLKRAELELHTQRSDYIGNLVMSAYRNKKTGLYALRIDPKLAKLLTDETLENDLDRVASLGRDYLAIWLHNYFASWGTFRNVPVEEIYKLCGTKTKKLRQFKYQLKSALTKIAEMEDSFIESFSIGSDNIVCVKKKKTHVRLLKPEHATKKDNSHASQREADIQAARTRRTKVAL